LIVGVIVLAIGLVLIQMGRQNLQRTSLKPEQTIETLKEDKEWVKEQTS
ncbi:MAG: phage holin family protein, partial [Thermomicrobiaceae bacterium]|nr:phage holin family protein [Thermomicrobiaceae bacterium]